MSLEDFVGLSCPYCGEPMEIGLEPDAADAVELYEDCTVCCRPAHIRTWRDAHGEWQVDVRRGHA